ncbi:MAG: hypothetical protein ACO2Y9_07960 [Pseudohongiellaceae bacterium]
MMKWRKKDEPEKINEKRKISEKTGALTGKTVRVIKNTPGFTKDLVVAAADGFKEGFREELPAKQKNTDPVDVTSLEGWQD